MDAPTLLFGIATLLATVAAALIPKFVSKKRTALLVGSGFGVLAAGFAAAAVLAFVGRPAPITTHSLCDPTKQVVISGGYFQSDQNGIILKHGASGCFEDATIKVRTNAITAEGR